jgi:hypothetical protein
MGYFPNGTSFCVWQDENCSDCLNYRDNGSGSFGCAITDAHFLLADKMHDSKCRRTTTFGVLNHFVPDDGPEAFQCRMRLTRQMLSDGKAAEQVERDRERYELAMQEMRADELSDPFKRRAA